MHLKTYSIPVFVIILISSRVIYFVSIQGKHNIIYFMRAEYLINSIQYFMIAILLLFYKLQNKYNKLLLKYGMVFSFSMSVYLLYVFLPGFISKYILFLAYPFFITWGFISFSLIAYLIFCLKGELIS